MTLQRRLVAVLGLLLVVGLAVVDVVTYLSVRSFLYGRADYTLASSETVAVNYLQFAEDHPRSHQTFGASSLGRRVSPDVYLVVENAAGRVVLRRPSGSPNHPDPAPILTGSIPVQQVPDAHHRFGRYGGTFSPDPEAAVVGSTGDPDGSYRVLAVTVPQGTLYTALSLNPTNDTLSSLERIEVVASLAVLVAAGVLGLWVVRRGLRPLRDMAETAGAIASGDLGRRVPVEPESTEVGRLGVALNQMLAQIERAFSEKSASEERLRQFVADASHELRTPLTSIRGYTELLRRGGIADGASRDRALRRVEDEAIRMGGLVEDLLLLAELDRGRLPRVEEVDLQRICSNVVEDSNALAHGHRLVLASGGPVLVRGDAGRVAQVALNLVGNALAHTPEGTTVTVSTRIERPWGVVRVSDDGPGMSAEEASRVFDRFYRGDPSRAGSGTGLGLPIVRAIAESFGGSAALSSTPGGGVTVTVALPLVEPATSRGAGDGADRAGDPARAPAAAAAAAPVSAGAPSRREPATRGPSPA